MHKMLSRGRTALREAAPAAARTLLCAALAAPGAHAQEAGGNPARAAGETGADDHSLPAVSVTGTRSFAEKNQLPQTTAGITAQQAAETINAMGTEDMLKYLPDVLVRKRFIGDTQSPMATRTTGINASARSLIYADGVLLSTLVNNNNGNGSPQWFMVAPQQVERIDVMYGPFSAAYPGNSYGAVTEIATRMPKKLEGSIEVTGAIQHFGQYGTSENEPSQQYSLTLGDRAGKLSWWFSASHLNSFSQPLSFGTVTQSTTPAGAALPVVSGAFAERNRTGGAIQVIGAGNFQHTLQDNAAIKLAYDFTPAVSAVYSLGYWQNDAKASARTYLSTAGGTPYYGGGGGSVNIGGFAYNASTIAGQFTGNNVEQQHLMQSLKVESHTQGVFDGEATVSNFYYLRDLSRLSTGTYPAALTGGPGRATDMSGTGWTTLDLKGTWRPQGVAGANIVSFGAHYDQFKLVSPTYTTADWTAGSSGALFSNSLGKTQTTALWLQDVWRVAPGVQATLGGRYEWWRAYDGYNFSLGSNGAGVSISQPSVDQSGFSPKASLTWDATERWSVTGSFGKALRFPTVGELYQSVQTGTTFTQANPFLQPERVLSSELAIERHDSDGKIRLSVFNEYVSNALISQTSNIAGFATPVSFTQNVGKTRQTGVELAGQQDNVLIRGLSLSGNATYVDSRILSDDSYVPTVAGATAAGKRVPYVPTWRATLAATYRPDNKWTYTLAGRYSSRVYATVDNTDVNPATYQGFQSFFVMDARVRYEFDKHWSTALGVDNLNNRKYFLFHPFPQRTFYLTVRYAL
ncbi:TonB-dependent receptor [Cupriavidus sp. WS]|uniref:TonB-dependent receptor n=1 Tax=Cupriavidus sp. WS TaxID=1312922 RepID=UPI00037C519D|nr:TonB-dependent receptor [Cupriavidus sp. WS]